MIRLLQLTRDGDAQAAARLLLEARRRSNVKSVLSACKVLTAPCPCCLGEPRQEPCDGFPAAYCNRCGDCSCPWPDGVYERSPTCLLHGDHTQHIWCEGEGIVGFENIDTIRESLRWVLTAIAPVYTHSTVAHEVTPVYPDDRAYWNTPYIRFEHLARHAANCARLLKGVQPLMRNRCRLCGQFPLSSGTEFHTWPRLCPLGHRGLHRPESAYRPAPTHALSLYMDALKLAFGSDWWEWWWRRCAASGWTCERIGSLEVQRTQCDVATVRKDGYIKCLAYTPPLAEVI